MSRKIPPHVREKAAALGVIVPARDGLDMTPVEHLRGVDAEAWNTHRAERVEEGYAAGKRMPPIDLWVYADGRTVLNDGNHRLSIARVKGVRAIPVQWTYEWRCPRK